MTTVLLWLLPAIHGCSVHWSADSVSVENGKVALIIDRRSGAYGVAWGSSIGVDAASSETLLSNGRLLRSRDFSSHTIARGDIRDVRDAFGNGIRVTVHNLNPGQPELRQVFWIYQNRPEVMVQLDVVGERRVASNRLVPFITAAALRIPHSDVLRSLFVPYDNDNYVRYRSDAWGSDPGSYEVGAVYDDRTRHGLVVGSLDHGQWKSAVQFQQDATALSVVAGVTSPETHDTQPHGIVSGRIIRSPRISLGWYGDWRAGMERYADLNALSSHPLRWAGVVPFGWSSWSGHKNKLTARDGRVATDFIKRKLPRLRNGGTAYINLDSFWDNLKESQRSKFVRHAHAAGLKAGIYYTPFTAWGKLTDRVVGTRYRYRDIVLKDAAGNPLPRLDGGYPIDPTHPGSIARVNAEMAYFMKLGFDFVKLDFLTHGALEGRHFDPNVQTGVEAYTIGMRRIIADLSARKVGRPVFIALSIAPMFPIGFGHSRRISCDVFANIGATEYLLNSSNYGWWTGGRLYRFNDADSSCVYQPLGEPPVSPAESRSRLTASVISGGIILDGDNLTLPAARTRVVKLFSNREVLNLARRAVSFRPVNGDTGSKAGDTFEWSAPDGAVYVAAFNFDKKKRVTRRLILHRLGIGGSDWSVHDLWAGAATSLTGDLKFDIPPMDCALVRLTRKGQHPNTSNQ